MPIWPRREVETALKSRVYFVKRISTCSSDRPFLNCGVPAGRSGGSRHGSPSHSIPNRRRAGETTKTHEYASGDQKGGWRERIRFARSRPRISRRSGTVGSVDQGEAVRAGRVNDSTGGLCLIMLRNAPSPTVPWHDQVNANPRFIPTQVLIRMPQCSSIRGTCCGIFFSGMSELSEMNSAVRLVQADPGDRAGTVSGAGRLSTLRRGTCGRGSAKRIPSCRPPSASPEAYS